MDLSDITYIAYLIICVAAVALFVVAVTLMNRGIGIRD